MNLVILGQLLSLLTGLHQEGRSLNIETGLTARPGRIKYFLKHLVFIGEKCYGHWFANVEWFYPVTDDLKYKFRKPTEIWNNSLSEQFGAASFMSVFCILSKFVYAPFEYRSKKLMVIIPRLNFSHV